MQALPDHHSVYSLNGAELLPPHLRDFSVALATVGQRDDTLTATLQAAFETGLPARVDTTLARALVLRCVARGSLRTHQELDVCAALHKLGAEVPAQRARTKYQEPHACPP